MNMALSPKSGLSLEIADIYCTFHGVTPKQKDAVTFFVVVVTPDVSVSNSQMMPSTTTNLEFLIPDGMSLSAMVCHINFVNGVQFFGSL